MKIVIVSCVAPPEPVVAGRVNWDIAEMLADQGHDVTFISPYPSRPLGKYDTRRKKTEIIKAKENLKHIRLNSFVYPKYHLLLRSYESWDFGIKAIRYIDRNFSDIDIIYTTPWPFLGQYAFVKFKKHPTTPVIMNVQDLYPESFFTKLKIRWIKSILSPLFSIDRYIAQQSTHLTCVSENLKDVYINNRGIHENKISVLENWQDETAFITDRDNLGNTLNSDFLENIKDKFVFMYLGNIGPVSGLNRVIEEFGLLDRSKNVLAIAGSGSYKDTCIELVDQLKLNNVLFTTVPPGLEAVVDLQSVADVLLLPINPLAAGSSVPSKLIAYLFSSKPVITSAERESDTGKVVMESGCGWLVDGEQPWHVVMEKVTAISEEERLKIGKRGFDYAMGRFSKKAGLEKAKELIESFEKK